MLVSRARLFVTQWTAAHQAPPSSVHEIFQARILEWVPVPGILQARTQEWVAIPIKPNYKDSATYSVVDHNNSIIRGD